MYRVVYNERRNEYAIQKKSFLFGWEWITNPGSGYTKTYPTYKIAVRKARELYIVEKDRQTKSNKWRVEEVVK